MRVTDEMVVIALRAFGDAMDAAGFLTYGGMDVGSRQDCIRAALEAALSHASWQEDEPMARVVHSETELTHVTLLPIAFTLGIGTHNLYAHPAVARSEGEEYANWTPTSDNINALPHPIRKYIHDLHTNTDAAGMVRENVLLREEVKRLAKLVNPDE